MDFFFYNYILHVCVATGGTNNYLYDQLWKLCAGPLFDPPKIGEEVYYFPQGHIEQAIIFFYKITIYFHICFDFHNLLKYLMVLPASCIYKRRTMSTKTSF